MRRTTQPPFVRTTYIRTSKVRAQSSFSCKIRNNARQFSFKIQSLSIQSYSLSLHFSIQSAISHSQFRFNRVTLNQSLFIWDRFIFNSFVIKTQTVIQSQSLSQSRGLSAQFQSNNLSRSNFCWNIINDGTIGRVVAAENPTIQLQISNVSFIQCKSIHFVDNLNYHFTFLLLLLFTSYYMASRFK